MLKNGCKRILIVMVPIITILFYIGDLRCQETSNNINPEYQSQYAEKSVTERKDDNINDDRNIGVEILELMIKRNLNYKYSKLEPEELEELVNRNR